MIKRDKSGALERSYARNGLKKQHIAQSAAFLSGTDMSTVHSPGL